MSSEIIVAILTPLMLVGVFLIAVLRDMKN